MKTTFTSLAVLIFSISMLTNCQKQTTIEQEPSLIIKFKFDPTQERLDNFGNPSQMPQGNAGLSPQFNQISAHYVELIPDEWTQLGNGEVLYQGSETLNGGALAIDFDETILAGEDEIFLSIPLKEIAIGAYEYIRVSLSYQNYTIQFHYEDQFVNDDFEGTAASFIGYNTYIRQFKTNQRITYVNANKSQGFWSFETVFGIDSGSAAGTTVPNPIADTSPIPLNSCLVTGAFEPGKLNITGNEIEDIEVILSLSTKNSFEWTEVKQDGKWEPAIGENIVDMGIRGLKPSWSK